MVLAAPELREQWLAELATMRQRLRGIRGLLAARGRAGAIDLAPIGRQQGLFSLLHINATDIERLRSSHGVYMAGSGRINVAGLTAAPAERLARCFEALQAA